MADFYPSPTMEQFMLSDAYVRVLAGPIGGGKSVCCAHELVRWASTQAPDSQNRRRTRFLIVRNTLDQLRSTTFKTITDWFPVGVYGDYRATDKALTYRFDLPDGTQVESEWMFIAMDEPDSVRKALSLECTGVWGNECRELRPEIADALLMRVNRFPSMKDGGATRAGAIFDTNMPGEDSWWENRMSNPPDNWGIFIQPPAVLTYEDYVDSFEEEPLEVLRGGDEVLYTINPNADNLDNLAVSYYPNTLLGKSADFIGVYLQCKFGRSLSGLPVYDKTFRHDKHVSRTPLIPIRSDNYPLCIGLDFGRTPAAAILQLTPKGKINCLSEVVGENMGIQTFVTTLLRPHLFERYPGLPCYIAPDPAGWQRTQLIDLSPVDYLKQAGFTVVRPATNSPKLRIEAVDSILTDAVDSEPRLSIDPSCRELIKGFRGGYKWRLNKHGDLADDVSPMKDSHSHLADAFQYACLVIDGHPHAIKKHVSRPVSPCISTGWT